MPGVKNGRVVVTVLGGPEVLKYVEEDLPEPGPGQVRVKVLAAGVCLCGCVDASRTLSRHTFATFFSRIRYRRRS